MASQSSTLFGNNLTKFLDYFCDKEGNFNLKLDDFIVRTSIITHNNEKLFPNPEPLPQLDAKPKSKPKVEPVQVTDLKQSTLKNVLNMSAGFASLIGLGILCPDPSFLTMTTILGLSTVAGYQSVWGVAHALHTPLMSITNAISGITAAGGLFLLGGGVVPSNLAQTYGALATFISAINIGGGFVITQRMLDMFKRPTDPKEYNYLYGVSGGVLAASILGAHMAGIPHIYQMGWLASSLCCLGGIIGLSSVPTARLGNALGITGISNGLLTTLLYMNFTPAVLTQAVALLGSALVVGAGIGKRVAVTDLPQTVALFHSLVGMAACLSCLSSFMVDVSPDNMHKVASFFGTFIGGITFSGSIVAYLKLANLMKSGYNLPMHRVLNRPLALSNVAAMSLMLVSGHGVGLAALYYTLVTSGLLGWNITNSIGSADMPVAITVLNSYSGWALCAEGFMLHNNLLTIVGSIIGSSGAILTYIMCRAMNRSLSNVIFGS